MIKEASEAILTRCRQLAIDAGRPGLPFSSTGSLGIRRLLGSVRNSYVLRALPKDTSSAKILEFLQTDAKST